MSILDETLGGIFMSCFVAAMFVVSLPLRENPNPILDRRFYGVTGLQFISYFLNYKDDGKAMKGFVRNLPMPRLQNYNIDIRVHRFC